MREPGDIGGPVLAADPDQQEESPVQLRDTDVIDLDLCAVDPLHHGDRKSVV